MPTGGYDPNTSMIGVIAIVVVIMLLRLVRGAKQRRIRVETMWIGPAIFIALAASLFYAEPPPASPVLYAILVVATVAGFGLGWIRGRMVQVSLNVETHQLMSQVSAMGMVILLIIMLARMGLRAVLTDHMAEWHISAAALTDGFMLFYVGMIVGRRVEIFLRCRKILAQAAAAKAAGQSVAEVVTEDHA